LATRKSPQFFFRISVYFAPMLKRFPLEVGTDAKDQKLECYQTVKKVWWYFYPVA